MSVLTRLNRFSLKRHFLYCSVCSAVPFSCVLSLCHDCDCVGGLGISTVYRVWGCSAEEKDVDKSAVISLSHTYIHISMLADM